MAADCFVVPTVTYRLLFVLVILAHDRRRIVHVAVTHHPTAAWTAQQLRNAFPEDHAPRYLLHDRDAAFPDVVSTIGAMQIHEVLTAPRSPWQNAYVERVIGCSANQNHCPQQDRRRRSAPLSARRQDLAENCRSNPAATDVSEATGVCENRKTAPTVRCACGLRWLRQMPNPRSVMLQRMTDC
jgi:hypothetical protein